jgi:hypothetical protein
LTAVATPATEDLAARRGVLIRPGVVILGVLAIWALAPFVAVLLHVTNHGGVLIGTNGADFFDQFQYLAWIRDAGSHGLASNLWVIGHTPHDYLHPMYLISGLLWRLGVTLQVAYLIWKPIAIAVLFLGFFAYVRHLLPRSRPQQASALLLGLFYLTPVLAIASWTGQLSAAHQYQLILATDDAYPALQLWGFEHTAIAIGLMPVFLIFAERLIGGGRVAERLIGEGRVAERLIGEGSVSDDTRRRWIAVAAGAGLLVAWLHPWQGAILLAIVGAMVVLKRPRRRYLSLAVPVAATLAPLIYGLVLSHADASWRAFEAESRMTGTAPWWALLASFGPLGLFAALGVRRSPADRDWMLILWVLACVGVYFVVPDFPPHALAGVTLPLAILAVRGWQRAAARLQMPKWAAAGLAVLAIGAFTVPAAVYHAQSAGDDFSNTISGAIALQQLRLTDNQAAAVSYLDRARRRGGVLAPWLLSMSIPGFTGREVFAGHLQWQPRSHLSLANLFFNPALNDPRGAFRRAILRQSKATFVVADCGGPRRLARDIAPLARPVRVFGCVTVYETH